MHEFRKASAIVYTIHYAISPLIQYPFAGTQAHTQPPRIASQHSAHTPSTLPRRRKAADATPNVSITLMFAVCVCVPLTVKRAHPHGFAPFGRAGGRSMRRCCSFRRRHRCFARFWANVAALCVQTHTHTHSHGGWCM